VKEGRIKDFFPLLRKEKQEKQSIDVGVDIEILFLSQGF
jgi:hypothetical protein